MTELIVAHEPLSETIAQHVPKPTAVTPGLTEATAPIWSASAGDGETGFWECTAGTFTARRDGYTEVCYILHGEATITTEGAEDRTVGRGDTFVTPSGWVGTWVVHSPLRKLYVIIPDAPGSPPSTS